MEARKTVDTLRRLPCPADTEWTRLAAGEIVAGDADALLAHAAECDACAASFKEAIFLLSEGTENLQGEAGDGLAHEDTDARSRQLASMMAVKMRRRPVPVWAAAAVVAAAVVPATIWVQRNTSPPPMAALTAAYSAHRNIELRMPGAAYGVMRAQRGKSTTTPELLESDAAIRRHLERHPADPEWLHAIGRLALLHWDFDEALERFAAAEQAGAESSAFWIDFATAHYQRAELRTERVSHESALKLLERVLQQEPKNTVALFNRAIVHRALGNVRAALDDLEQCTRWESDAGWRQEALRLANTLRKP